MTDLELLSVNCPILRYDTLEQYFAMDARAWLIGNTVRRVDGTDLIKMEESVGLDWLGPKKYLSGAQALSTDVIAHDGKDYWGNYQRILVDHPDFDNTVYGRVAREGDDTWVQYWFFYYYNLAVSSSHECDWEMVQYRIVDDAIDLAAYSQHSVGETSREVEFSFGRPIVYVAAGSHANYFKPGVHQTVSFDRANGRGRETGLRLEILPAHGWPEYPGRWGDTIARSDLASSSPFGPGRHKQWRLPSTWAYGL